MQSLKALEAVWEGLFSRLNTRQRDAPALYGLEMDLEQMKKQRR
jgi:hypothetical protein